jgi:cellulose synthase/poly-beta-1,6-N-acetylglucosamine synthase-like glycosyltransferase
VPERVTDAGAGPAPAYPRPSGRVSVALEAEPVLIAAWTVIALSAAWVGFAYAGYPLLLALLARLRPRPVARADAAPSLAVVIAVHNGAALLAHKLERTLALAYPRPFEVIVASDASTDATDAIAQAQAGRGVRLVRNATRRGKEAAQGAGIRATSAEVLVFTDLAAELSADALRAIVRPFADPSVGCVSSEDRVESGGGEGTYVRLEMALRRWESEASTLVGLSGSFFAARRELCEPWPPALASDFRTPLEAARRGLRAVSEPAATASFRAIDDPAGEWRRKVRTVRRGIAVLAAYRDLLHPRHGRVAFSLWGHKAARFTAPFALLLLLASSAAAAPQSPLAALLLGAQLAGYLTGGLALWSRRLARFAPARLLGFFLLVNASMLAAWGYHGTGRRAVTWEPTRR